MARRDQCWSKIFSIETLASKQTHTHSSTRAHAPVARVPPPRPPRQHRQQATRGVPHRAAWVHDFVQYQRNADVLGEGQGAGGVDLCENLRGSQAGHNTQSKPPQTAERTLIPGATAASLHNFSKLLQYRQDTPAAPHLEVPGSHLLVRRVGAIHKHARQLAVALHMRYSAVQCGTSAVTRKQGGNSM
jgi:hypothetical protein